MITYRSHPDVASIDRALQSLGPRASSRAALHLALPVSDAVGLQARVVGDKWVWRGADVVAGTSRVAVMLADLCFRDGDTYLDLGDSEPWEWVKPVHSGSRVISFGSDLLLGLPLLHVAPDHRALTTDAVRAALNGELRPGVRWKGLTVEAFALGWKVG